MQHHGDAEFGAEVLGVATEGLEGLGGGMEQDLVEHRGVALRQGVELVRQGEDYMEVRDGEEVRFPCLDPAQAGDGLAKGAVPVVATVVQRDCGPAAVALMDVPPEQGGAAGCDVSQDLLALWYLAGL